MRAIVEPARSNTRLSASRTARTEARHADQRQTVELIERSAAADGRQDARKQAHADTNPLRGADQLKHVAVFDELPFGVITTMDTELPNEVLEVCDRAVDLVVVDSADRINACRVPEILGGEIGAALAVADDQASLVFARFGVRSDVRSSAPEVRGGGSRVQTGIAASCRRGEARWSPTHVRHTAVAVIMAACTTERHSPRVDFLITISSRSYRAWSLAMRTAKSGISSAGQSRRTSKRRHRRRGPRARQSRKQVQACGGRCTRDASRPRSSPASSNSARGPSALDGRASRRDACVVNPSADES